MTFCCRVLKGFCISKQGFHNYNKLSNNFKQSKIDYLRKMAVSKCRQDPVVTKLNSPEFNSLFTEELTYLASIFKKYDYELRIAGGAVRDLLLGKQPKDLDFATTATPTQMKNMFNSENIRLINMNGEKHGTITPRINDRENFEVTTLRVDLNPDGRHAEVEFTTDWLLDANRRDLTINSMFLDLDGLVYDFFFGYDDLKKHHVAFVGDAATRIKEDYLRILRYFRFYGRIALESNCHEDSTLQAIKENVEGLADISGERLWLELKQILTGNYAGELLLEMLKCNVGKFIGLPQDSNVDNLQIVWERSKKNQMQAITLLISLLNSEEDVWAVHNRLRLSAYERDLALFLINNRKPTLCEDPLEPYYLLLINSKFKQSHVREWIIEVLKYNNSPHLEEFENWNIPKFPVTGTMLKERGVENGRFMGLVLNELKSYWAKNKFCLNTDEILKQLPHTLDMLNRKKNKN